MRSKESNRLTRRWKFLLAIDRAIIETHPNSSKNMLYPSGWSLTIADNALIHLNPTMVSSEKKNSPKYDFVLRFYVQNSLPSERLPLLLFDSLFGVCSVFSSRAASQGMAPASKAKFCIWGIFWVITAIALAARHCNSWILLCAHRSQKLVAEKQPI